MYSIVQMNVQMYYYVFLQEDYIKLHLFQNVEIMYIFE